MIGGEKDRMCITVLGIIIVIVSVLAFFRNEKFLLKMTIFLSVFTAGSILNTDITNVAIQMYRIPMFLWCLKQVINFIKSKPKINLQIIKDILKNNKIFTALLIFSCTIILSGVWLFVSKSNYTYELYSEEYVITFNISIFKQIIGILKYFAFCMILSLTIKDKKEIKELLKTFVAGSVFAVIWGFIQYILYYLGVEYPAFIFNNNNLFDQWYTQIMHGVKRICSIATEPSVFSLNLLGFLPIILIPWLLRKEDYLKKEYKLLTVLVIATIVCTILTTSSTAIVGLTVLMGVLIIYLLISGIRNKELEENKKIITNIVLISIVSIIIALILAYCGMKIYNVKLVQVDDLYNEERLSDTLKEMTVDKLSSDSGMERTNREIVGMKIYIQSPIFGVGFVSYRTYTLYTNILVNTGILGFFALIYLLFVVIKKLIINMKKDKCMALIFLLSILGMSIVFLISVPDLIYVYFWAILVLAYKYFDVAEDNINTTKKENLIIGIDARGLDRNKAGIATYIEQIIKKINQDEKQNNTYILYSNREINIDVNLKKNIITKNYKKPIGTLWLYFMLPRILKKDKVDIFWGTQHVLPERNNYTENIKYVLTVHDLSNHKLKNIGEWKNAIIQKSFLKTSCKHADTIIAVSKSTKQDIVELFNIPEEKIRVVYEGTNFEKKCNLEEEKNILKKFDVEDRNYLLFVSTIEPRKNIITLIKAFEYLKDNGQSKLKLILAGGLGWKYEPILEAINTSKYKNDINQAGYISKEEKECLLHNAKAFVYPSLYEGFGLPILEAMANEAIVVTSNISSIPEVGGDAALYYNNVMDYKELATVIEKTLKMSDKEKKDKIKLGQEQIKKFTWDKCSKETLKTILEDC